MIHVSFGRPWGPGAKLMTTGPEAMPTRPWFRSTSLRAGQSGVTRQSSDSNQEQGHALATACSLRLNFLDLRQGSEESFNLLCSQVVGDLALISWTPGIYHGGVQ